MYHPYSQSDVCEALVGLGCTERPARLNVGTRVFGGLKPELISIMQRAGAVLSGLVPLKAHRCCVGPAGALWVSFPRDGLEVMNNSVITAIVREYGRRLGVSGLIALADALSNPTGEEN